MQNFSPHEKSDMIYLLKYSRHLIAKHYFQSIVALFLHFTQSWATYACTCTSHMRPKNMLGENVQYLLNLYIPNRCGVTSAYDDARLFVKIRTRSALCHYSRVVAPTQTILQLSGLWRITFLSLHPTC